MICARCPRLINKVECYELIDGSHICPYCAVVGEELMPDDQGSLQVSPMGKETTIRLYVKAMMN